MRLEPGQVAVVTGAASGIGLGLAQAFAERGLAVVLADIEEKALVLAEKAIAGFGVETLAAVTDVSDPAAVEDLAARVTDRFGRVDVACNNAGVIARPLRPIWEFTPEDWTWVMGVNLGGVVNGIRAFVPRMVDQGHGHIVNTASLAGVSTTPFLGPYTPSKHAVVALSESLRAELDQRAPGVGVSVLCPGFVGSRLYDAARNRPARSMATAASRRRGRPAEPEADLPMAAEMQPAELAAAALAAVEANRLHVIVGAGAAEATRARLAGLEAALTR